MFHELIEQDARGQVVIDRRNGSDALRATRSYDPVTGWLEEIQSGSTQTWRRRVGGVAVVNLTGANETVRWLFHDHLGSVDAVTHDNGVLAAGESMSFDAHGRRRDVGDWQGQPASNPQQTTRGFTGHEQIDAHERVHMNGRVYDPLLGRFIQADPIVQDPYAPQNWNRYTYVYNNPLNGTDPSGFSSTGTWIGAIVAIITIGAMGGTVGLLTAGKGAIASHDATRSLRTVSGPATIQGWR